MITLILATEATTAPPGDDFQTIAFIALGIVMLVAAITTVIVTPRAEKH